MAEKSTSELFEEMKESMNQFFAQAEMFIESQKKKVEDPLEQKGILEYVKAISDATGNNYKYVAICSSPVRHLRLYLNNGDYDRVHIPSVTFGSLSEDSIYDLDELHKEVYGTWR